MHSTMTVIVLYQIKGIECDLRECLQLPGALVGGQKKLLVEVTKSMEMPVDSMIGRATHLVRLQEQKKEK